MLIAIAIVMFILIVASTWWFGLWSNVITLINLLISALVASSLYHPIFIQLVATFQTDSNTRPSHFEYFDFLSVWIAFVLTYVILRGATDMMSGFRLKFDPLTEIIGRSVLSIWIACVFICFSFFTLQMAPLPPAYYSSKDFVARKDLGTLPDKLWLAFIQSRSRGALSASKAKGIFPEYQLPVHPDDTELNVRVFDPFSGFLVEQSSFRSSVLGNAQRRDQALE